MGYSRIPAQVGRGIPRLAYLENHMADLRRNVFRMLPVAATRSCCCDTLCACYRTAVSVVRETKRDSSRTSQSAGRGIIKHTCTPAARAAINLACKTTVRITHLISPQLTLPHYEFHLN